MKHEDLIEELRKNALPIHPKCLGLEFTEEDEKCRTADRCDRIVPENIFEVIDEPTGAIDAEATPEVVIDETCRCEAYINPASFWRRGGCPLATHWGQDESNTTGKVRVGQQKQKKK